VSATLQTLVTQVLIQSTNVATGIITARSFGPDGRGHLSAMILPGNLANAMTLGIPAAVTYNFKRHPDQRRALFSAAMVLSLGLGILTAVVGYFVIPLWLHHYSAQDIHIARIIVFVAPVTMMTLAVAAVLAVEGEFTTANQTRYLIPVLTLGGLIGLRLSHSLTPVTAAFAYILPSIPVFALRVAPMWRRFYPHLAGLGPSARRLLGYGIRSYGVDLLGAFALQVDQALVVSLLSPSAMGTYVVALSLSRVLNIVQASIVTVLLPTAAARPVREVVALTGRAARVSTAVATLAAGCIAIAGPVVLRLLYGTRFLGAVPVFRILLVEVVLSGATWILAQAFMAVGRPGVVTTLRAFGLSLSVPLMIGLTLTRLPVTYASSVETVLSIALTHGMPNTRRTARTATPSTPAAALVFIASCKF